MTKCAGGFCLLAITYIIFRMIPLDVLFVVGVTVAVFAIIAKRQWKRLRQNGTHKTMQDSSATFQGGLRIYF